jgi:hypothetical protein
MPDTYNVSGLTRKSSFYQTGDQKISAIKKSFLIQCVVKLQWCPGDKFDALLRGYQQPDFQLYQ